MKLQTELESKDTTVKPRAGTRCTDELPLSAASTGARYSTVL